ncbi:MAG: DUF1178 family protein [Alphaproteobacteria bacterium]|nr:DUF1178 family protein [Alphaproteobacteria bacterium]
MVRFQLKCVHGDYFDAWFCDRATYDAQLARGQVGCPMCGETDVAEAPPMKPGLYPDLNEDQARQMACDTRRMLESWLGRGVLEIATAALTVEAARVLPTEPDAGTAEAEIELRPAPQPAPNMDRTAIERPAGRSFAYDC